MGCASSGPSGAVQSDAPAGDVSNGGIMKDAMAKMGAKGESIMDKAKGLVDSEIAQPISNLADDAMKKVHGESKPIEVGEVVEDKIESLFCSTDEKKQELQNGLDAMVDTVKPDTPIDDIEKNMKQELDEMMQKVEEKVEETIGEEEEEKKEEEEEEKLDEKLEELPKGE